MKKLIVFILMALLNCFADLDSEVILDMKPEHFLKYVEISITLSKSKTVLTAMDVTFPTSVSKDEMNDWFRSLPPLSSDFNEKYLKSIRQSSVNA